MNRPTRTVTERRPGAEDGAALIEFALVSLVLYLLLASTVDFGRLFFSAQGLQDVARVAAREFATAPLPAVTTFDAAALLLRGRVYDPDQLVLDITGAGLLRGLKMRDDPMPLRGKLSDRGLLVGTAGNNTLRLAPPLIVTEADVREAIDIIDQQFATMMTAAGS